MHWHRLSVSRSRTPAARPWRTVIGPSSANPVTRTRTYAAAFGAPSIRRPVR